MGTLVARICLPQQLLGAEVCGAECAKPGSGGQRFGSPARGPSPQQPAVGRVPECPMMSAPILVYIVGGIRENSDER